MKKVRLFRVSSGDADYVHLTREVGPYWSTPTNWVGHMHVRSADRVIAHVDAMARRIEALETEIMARMLATATLLDLTEGV